MPEIDPLIDSPIPGREIVCTVVVPSPWGFVRCQLLAPPATGAAPDPAATEAALLAWLGRLGR